MFVVSRWELQGSQHSERDDLFCETMDCCITRSRNTAHHIRAHMCTLWNDVFGYNWLDFFWVGRDYWRPDGGQQREPFGQTS